MSAPSPALAPTEAAHALYVQHHGWLLGQLRRKLGSSWDAADLAQDTFVRVLLKPETLPGLREPRAYLRTVARGLLADHWRRRSLEQAWLEALAALPEALAPDPQHVLTLRQTLQQLDDMLGRLPTQAREVFVLSQLQGLGYAQIATRLGLSERTVKRHMARGFELCLTLID